MKARIYFLHSGDFVPKYIGSTLQDLKTRRENHASDFRLNTPKTLWVKSIDRVYIELIEECDKSMRYEREEYYTILNSKTVLNVRIGTKHTEDHKKHISIVNTGQKRTTEQIENIKRSLLHTHKKVVVNGIKYGSIHEASRHTKLSPGFICSCCKGDKKYSKFPIQYGEI